MSSAFNFQSDLPHQVAAIENVAELFDGLDKRATAKFSLNEDIIGNADEWDDLADDLIEENLYRVRDAHNRQHPEAALSFTRLERLDGEMLDGVSVDSHSCPDFSIEMETGTGKTYVYLRTMLELHRRFGCTKFVVVVPSVAILEGVKKSFDDLRDHFNGLFGVTNFSRKIYDGSKPGIVPAFARDTFPTVLVMTLQSFTRASNNIYKANDAVISELRPYQWLQLTRPVVILDEPQNMRSDKAKQAIRTLRPLFVLRYSATHRKDDMPTPVYRLTPVQAFRLGLVKQVEVTGIAELGLASRASIELVEVTRDPIRAKVRALCMERDGTTTRKLLILKQKDDVFKQTGIPEHEGLRVGNIRVAGHNLPAEVEFEGGDDGGRILSAGDDLQTSSEEAWAAQIEETIRRHFERQRVLRVHGVKVLSLFFVDRVANYQGAAPRIRNLFDKIFDRLKVEEADFRDFAASDVREAYFATARQKKKGGGEEEVALDDVKADSEEARRAFELIMRRKETLLSFPDERDPGTKVAFIFAHSALKEGWDNPNVFQICTLNQTVSVMKKRQEIGRGLRLCVSVKNGRFERLVDPELNVLTVVANESYETYVRSLQTEYREDGGDAPPKPSRARQALAKRRDTLLKKELFQRFWDKLCQRMEYTIDLDTDALVTECVERLNDREKTRFPKPKLAVTRGRFIVVEYTVEFVKALSADRAQLRIREISTQADAQQNQGLVLPSEALFNVQKEADLAKMTRNPHLRGFKVLEVGRSLGEMRVRFANEVEIGESAIHHFSTNRIDKNPSEEVDVAEVEHAVPDFIGRAADETHLTRATLWRVFSQVSAEQKATLRAHPEGWANTFVRVVGDRMKDHIADRLRFRNTGVRDEDLGDPEVAFPPEVHPVQRELIDGGPKSLYDKVQVDSDVERAFVNDHLRPDEENLVVYFKFPPRFKIGLPKVIGNYNPDWGILRQGADDHMTLELVRETKGSDDLERLRFLNEGRKLILAERYFGALGINYRFVSPDVEVYWESRGQAAARRRSRLGRTGPGEGVPVVVYDLKAAATAFSEGQAPEEIGTVLLPARRPGLFVAQIVGESMNRVAPDGAWCLWQHFGASGAPAEAPGELVIVRKQDPADPALGGFTFKRWVKRDAAQSLEPMSTHPKFQPIMLNAGDEHEMKFIARFIEVLHIDSGDILDVDG